MKNANNDIEESKSEAQNGRISSPPSYFGQSEALMYQMKRLESKIEQLDILHKRHLDRPTLDDTNEEEAQINSATKDICNVSKRFYDLTFSEIVELTNVSGYYDNFLFFQSFNACHQQIKSIRRSTLYSCTGLESIVAKNVVTYLVNRLQELTVRFRTSQNNYLKSKYFLIRNLHLLICISKL